MLQGGPLPCFLKEEQLQTLLNGQYPFLRKSERQFQSGLAKFGLIEVRIFKLINFMLLCACDPPQENVH